MRPSSNRTFCHRSSRASLAAPALFGVLGVLGLLASGCSGPPGVRACDAPSPAVLAAAPGTLSATGLYQSAAGGAVAEGVVAYRPRFELHGDGAGRARWVSLPPGTTIDAHDMDRWRFPRGTKLWKELARDGRPLETRLLEKVGDGEGPEAWLAVAYVWNREGTEAYLSVEGEAEVNGTPHEVPAARRCQACHGGSSSFVLGFSAVQLAGDTPSDDALLARLARDGRLSAAPAPAYPVPGGADARAALGYLHANCSHCHNQRRPPHGGARCFDPRTSFDLELRTTDLTAATTATARTTLGGAVLAGDPSASPLYRRIAGADFLAPRMPILGSPSVDTAGLALVGRWIEGLR